MNIIPRDPWFNVDTFFDDLFAHRHLLDKEAPYKPRIDIIDKDDHYLFVAELPGVEKKDINVNLHNGILTIEAKTYEETTSETEQIIRKERRAGFFSRSISVGENINADEIKAELNNGLLKLTAPKPEHPIKETHKIDIS